MADVLTKEQRRLNMSRVKGRDTKPEMIIRRGLHAKGLRFRLHRRDLPGRPDLVLPRHRVIILVHGCFWHGHGCHLCKTPRTRTGFWKSKIAKTVERDQRTTEILVREGWRVLIVWECALRGSGKIPIEQLLEECEAFIQRSAIVRAELSAVNAETGKSSSEPQTSDDGLSRIQA